MFVKRILANAPFLQIDLLNWHTLSGLSFTFIGLVIQYEWLIIGLRIECFRNHEWQSLIPKLGKRAQSKMRVEF